MSDVLEENVAHSVKNIGHVSMSHDFSYEGCQSNRSLGRAILVNLPPLVNDAECDDKEGDDEGLCG